MKCEETSLVTLGDIKLPIQPTSKAPDAKMGTTERAVWDLTFTLECTLDS